MLFLNETLVPLPSGLIVPGCLDGLATVVPS